MAFRVFVDDNYHFMDEDERYELGAFPTKETAIEAAQRIVDECLRSAYRLGMTPKQLYDSYVSSGDDPFVVGEGAERVSFSAWDYAKQRCNELCTPDGSGI